MSFGSNETTNAFIASKGFCIILHNLDTQEHYWLFLSSPISNQIKEDLKSQNLSTRLTVDTGFIGTGNVCVYEVIKNK